MDLSLKINSMFRNKYIVYKDGKRSGEELDRNGKVFGVTGNRP